MNTETMNAANMKSKSSKLVTGRVALAGAMLVLLASSAGCGEEGASSAEEPATEEASNPAVNVVAVAADGTRFDPAVNASQIPDGSWMCDMNGQVHYASRTQGDGTCPICSMELVHKGAHGPGHSGDHPGGKEARIDL